VSDLSSTAGVVALVAGGIALLALLLTGLALRRLQRIRSDQLAVIGEGSPRDVVGYVRELESRLEALRGDLNETGERGAATARRVDGAITHSAVVRYDAYNEVSGRQSSSIALLDDRRNGVVLSSILHREQARVYAKRISAGESDLGLSPEEQAAVDAALGEG
jgi:hypothetical protein